MKILAQLFLASFLMASVTATAQAVLYDVIIAGRTVGSVRVHYGPGTDAGRRRIEAEYSIPFYSGSFSSENQFADGILKTSRTEQKVNGKTKEQTRTFAQRSRRYQIDFLETSARVKHSRDLKFGISSTLTNLYYEEPVDIGEVYSEKYGEMCDVKMMGEGSYTVTLPNGKQSIYSYSDGQCREVQAELAGLKLRIVKRNNRLAKR